MSPIGFVILVNPLSRLCQTERLIGTLNRMFDHPPIVCHHDFGQNPNWIAGLPSNVKISRPHVATGWGTFGCVEATIRALGMLYSGDDAPEWYVYLSGADYPIKPADKILADLNASPFDGHIEHRLISEGDLSYPQDPDNPRGWKHDTWLRQCHKRYCSLRVDVRGINRYLRPSTRTLWLESPWIINGRIPFSATFKCYSGEVWYCANHRCAKRLIEFFEKDTKVAVHYRQTLVPEESYPQTVLANCPNLKLSQNTFRYIDWTGGGSNPKVLGSEDLNGLQKSKFHFARKFDDQKDSNVLNEIDLWLF